MVDCAPGIGAVSEVLELERNVLKIRSMEQLQQFRRAHPLQRLATGGAEWQYIACGQGEHALLLLPGAMGTAESSFDRMANTEDRFRVVSPSYPPLGTMAALSDGLAAVLDAEGIVRTHVLGHSLGAGIAHAFVRRHPERVDKLVLSGFGLYSHLPLVPAGGASRSGADPPGQGAGDDGPRDPARDGEVGRTGRPRHREPGECPAGHPCDPPGPCSLMIRPDARSADTILPARAC